ncbi:unnamed protein product [Brugia pahangi]|uniref:Fibrinogen C-terminal domain-containing protein n=1 Tax=Brugia pahangi TaxID=6280 RepID=A0A0N4T0K2_BRUPA|nr:unnamed protein product [Brugia pahangi]
MVVLVVVVNLLQKAQPVITLLLLKLPNPVENASFCIHSNHTNSLVYQLTKGNYVASTSAPQYFVVSIFGGSEWGSLLHYLQSEK